MSDINITVNDEIVNIDIVDEPVLVNVVNSPGVPGAPGVGVPVGGTTGQVLAKNSATNYDTEWVDVSGGAWGTITGTLSNQTDLQTALNGKFDDPTGTTSQYLRGDGSLATFPSLTGYVPYTGATSDVNLGTHRILAQNATIASSGSGDTFTLNHSSGSGIGLNITKGGNGEGLYINKTGGSGNAATIIGTLNATTLVKSGGTSSQFLKADGTVDSSVYVPTSRELTINGVTYDLSANRSWTVAGGITGSGASGQVAYWTGTSAQSGSNNLFWDNANGRLGIGTNVPSSDLSILKSSTATVQAYIKNSSTGLVADTRIVIANDASLEGGFFIGSSTRTLDASSVLVYANRQMRFMTNNLVSTGGTDAIIFQAGGSNPSQEGMRVTGTKNILIGTTSDSGQRLQVQGTTLLNGNVTFSSATGMFWDATNGRLGIGTNAPAFPLEIVTNLGVNLGRFQIKNTNANSDAQVSVVNNNNHFGLFFKTGNAYTTYRTILPNDLGFYNSGSGDISFLNDIGLGNIKFTAGASSTAHMTLHNTGNLLLGSTTNSGERLQVTGTMKVTGASSFGGNASFSTGTSSQGTKIVPSTATLYTSDIGINTTAIYNSSTSTTSDVWVGYVGGSASSNIYTYFQSSGYIGTRGGLRIGASTGSDVLSVLSNSWLRINAGTTTRSQISLASSTAPTSPNDGDIWFDGTDIKMRIGGVTKTFTLL